MRILGKLKKGWLIYFADWDKSEARLRLMIGKRVRVEYKPAGFVKGQLTSIGMAELYNFETHKDEQMFTLFIDELPLAGFQNIKTVSVD